MSFVSLPITSVIVKKRMRPATRDKVETLAKSIAEIGLLNPISVQPDHTLVAGLHRLEAFKLLGLAEIPAQVVEYQDALDLELAEIDENLIRNELSELEESLQLARRKEIYEAKHPEVKQGATGRGGKKDCTVQSFSADTASKTGKDKSTISRKTQIGSTLAPIADTLLDTAVADSQKDLLALARMDEEERQEVVERIVSGAKDVKEAKQQIKQERQQAIPADLPAVADRYRLIHADLATVALDPESVDAIITDPPYPREYLPCYESLAKLAAHALKPGGSLLVMTGQSYLPDVLALMTPHLHYHWTLAYLTPGGQAVQLWERHVTTFWKPILWLVKGDYKGAWVSDVAKSAVNDNDKRFHHWGQSESGMADLIERFTLPGQTILDPFLGGGTTGVVALSLNRRFIGIDKDQEAITTSLQRIAQAV